MAKGEDSCGLISKTKAVEILGTMLGGYNIETLVALLEHDELGDLAGEQLKKNVPYVRRLPRRRRHGQKGQPTGSGCFAIVGRR